MFKFFLDLLARKERVFNDQTGILKVFIINKKKYIKPWDARYLELIPQDTGNYKVFDPFINLSGQLEFESLK